MYSCRQWMFSRYDVIQATYIEFPAYSTYLELVQRTISRDSHHASFDTIAKNLSSIYRSVQKDMHSPAYHYIHNSPLQPSTRPEMTSSIHAIITVFFVFANLTQAWIISSTNRNEPSTIDTTRSSRTLIFNGTTIYQLDNDNHEYTISSINDLDTNLRLQMALQMARNADMKFGLCTPESRKAWSVVDDIYSSSSSCRKVEDNVKRVLGEEKSIWSTFEQRQHPKRSV